MIAITLRKEGKDVTFTQDFFPVKLIKKTIDIQNIYSSIEKSGMTEEAIDKLINFEVELYGNKFTVEEFENGFNASQIFTKVVDDMNAVLGYTTEKFEEVPTEKN